MIAVPSQEPDSRQLYTKIPQNTQVGIDSGNGQLKLESSNGFSLKMPSILYFPHSDVTMGDIDQLSSYIVYEGGTRGDLLNKGWVVGREAYLLSPNSHISTSDDKESKVRYSLELLLGIVAHTIESEKVNLTVSISIHDKQALGKEIKTRIEGHHRIIANGRKTEVTVKMKDCVNEGVGAYFELITRKKFLPSQTVLLLDIGEGTIITSVFGNRQLKHRKSYPLGTSKLYQNISNNVEMRRKLKGITGNIQLIKLGIERGDFIYGNNRKISFNFKEIYNKELMPWFSDSIYNVMASITDWMNEASHLFAIGGGVNLPSLKKGLENQHFEVLEQSDILNAKGLLKIAQRE